MNRDSEAHDQDAYTGISRAEARDLIHDDAITTVLADIVANAAALTVPHEVLLLTAFREQEEHAARVTARMSQQIQDTFRDFLSVLAGYLAGHGIASDQNPFHAENYIEGLQRFADRIAIEERSR